MSELAQGDGLRRLDLRIEPFAPGAVDEFEVVILLDGEELLEDRRLELSAGVGFVGFDPWDILGTDAPLLPPHPIARVAIGRCGCLAAGCNALAPLILERGDSVVWSDFRKVPGIYEMPIADVEPDLRTSSARDMPDVVFDRAQYRAEVERASTDYSWETPQRRTERLLYEGLNREADRLHGLGWRLRGRGHPCSRPFWLDDRIQLILQDVSGPSEPWPTDITVLLQAEGETPPERAALMVEFLLRTPPGQWPRPREDGV